MVMVGGGGGVGLGRRGITFKTGHTAPDMRGYP